jgi:ubiquinone/menaquinone biosynthesis C-methylase UbiE
MLINDVKQFFDEHAPRWDEICFHDPEKLRTMIALAQIPKNARIADLACGTGVILPYLLEKEPKTIAAVDLSEKMIAVAKQKYTDSRVSFFVSDLFDLKESGFDTVVLYSAYPHIPDKRALARKLSSLLLPGGRFLIAHSEGRAAINERHHDPDTAAVSIPLRPVREEIESFCNWFEVDIQIDTLEFYVFSGLKK